MNQRLLNEIAAAFRQLDFSDENASVDALKAEIATLYEAIAKADARRSEISRTLIEDRGPDARAVADGLLSDVSAMEAASSAPSRAEMEAERAALAAGVRDLNERARDAREKIQEVESKAFQRLGPLIKPLLDELAADAREAAERIVQAFSALETVGYATRYSGELDKVSDAVAGIIGEGCLLRGPYQNLLEAPGEIVEMLSTLRDKGSALPVRIATSVSVPTRPAIFAI